MNKRVGFIGIGVMGRPMVQNLLRAGYEVVAYDVAAEALTEIAADGAMAATGSADVASCCDVMITMLPTSVEGADAVLGHGGALEGAKSGSLLIDMSTMSRRVAAAGTGKSVAVLDAPVSGGDVGDSEGWFVPDCDRDTRPRTSASCVTSASGRS